MKKRLLPIFGLLAGLVFVTSCLVQIVDPTRASAVRMGTDFHEAVPLVSGGTLSLNNTDGDIQIMGWEKEGVEVFAERLMHRSYNRGFRWQPLLSPVPKIDIDTFEDFVKVKTRSSSQEEDASIVNYYLNVPQHVKLKDIIARKGKISISDLYGEISVELKEGKIDVENCSGSLDVSLSKGSVKAGLLDLRSDDEIRISTQDGDITVYLEANINAWIEADTPEGQVASDFEQLREQPSGKVSAQLGEDGCTISLSSMKGDIKIRKLK